MKLSKKNFFILFEPKDKMGYFSTFKVLFENLTRKKESRESQSKNINSNNNNNNDDDNNNNNNNNNNK